MLFKKEQPPWNKGKKMSLKLRQKLSQSHKGKKLSYETRKKMSKTHKERGTGLWMIGRKDSIETRLKKKDNHKKAFAIILEQIDRLEKSGYRCFPVDHCATPDIVAIKNGKVYAIEVEKGNRTISDIYEKYQLTEKYFDDIICLTLNRT